MARGGAIVDSYDKVHLVPFGEYLPFDHLLRAPSASAISWRSLAASNSATPGMRWLCRGCLRQRR